MIKFSHNQYKKSKKNLLGISRGIFRSFLEIAERYIILLSSNLEEERYKFLKILLMLGLTAFFATFGLISLVIVIIWSIDSKYRIYVMIITTAILLLAAIISGIWTAYKARHLATTKYSRQGLNNNRKLL